MPRRRLLRDGAGKVKYFEGTPIPTSVSIVLLLAGLHFAGKLSPAIWLGQWEMAGLVLHPLTIIYALSGSLMIIYHPRAEDLNPKLPDERHYSTKTGRAGTDSQRSLGAWRNVTGQALLKSTCRDSEVRRVDRSTRPC